MAFGHGVWPDLNQVAVFSRKAGCEVETRFCFFHALKSVKTSFNPVLSGVSPGHQNSAWYRASLSKPMLGEKLGNEYGCSALN